MGLEMAGLKRHWTVGCRAPRISKVGMRCFGESHPVYRLDLVHANQWYPHIWRLWGLDLH